MDDCENEFHLRLQSEGYIFQKKVVWGYGPALHIVMYRCMQTHAQSHTHTHAETQTVTCMDGCTQLKVTIVFFMIASFTSGSNMDMDKD